jgi:hypothetical protein
MGWPTALLGQTNSPVRFAERPAGRARSCILIYLLGGPPHLDMLDLKPEAPQEVRGPFAPIATNVPGVQICELLPKLARSADKYALVRSVSHPNSNHTPMIYYTLTGRPTAQPLVDNDIRPPQRSDFPHVGSVLAKFKAAPSSLPGFIALPELAIRSSTKGEFKRARSPLRGGGAGFLGTRFDPLTVNGEPGTREAIPALALPDRVSSDRLDSRAALLSLLDQPARSSAARAMHDFQQQAVLLTGAANRGTLPAFSLDDEPAELRDRYGRHRFGQTMLLARRLAEAGVPMVSIHFNEMTVCDGWDTHSKNFDALKSELLPWKTSISVADWMRRWSSAWASSAALRRSTGTPAAIIGATVARRCWRVAAFVAGKCWVRRIASGLIPCLIKWTQSIFTPRSTTAWAWILTARSTTNSSVLGTSPPGRCSRGCCSGRSNLECQVAAFARTREARTLASAATFRFRSDGPVDRWITSATAPATGASDSPHR